MTTTTPNNDNKKLINLLRGWPSPSMLPSSLLLSASTKVLTNPNLFIPALQYGPDPGYQPLREALALWLRKAYSVPPSPNRLCITGGASQGLACILASFTDPGYTKVVWAGEPCYYLACPIFEDAGFKGRIRGVREDEGGLDAEELERGLRGYKDPGRERKLYRHIIYGVATCGNPSGRTLGLERRRELVRVARKYDALVVVDDVYDFLQWKVGSDGAGDGRLPEVLPRLSDIDIAMGRSEHEPEGKHFGHAISNGSFSKLVGPGARTGWVHGTEDFALGLSQTGSTRSGGAPSQLCAAMITELVTSGELDEHLETNTRPALQARHARTVAAVKRELGECGVEVLESSEKGKNVYGGYFVWLTLPEGGPDAGEVAERAKREENLVVAPGKLFEVGEGAKFGRNIRLCFSWEDMEDVEEGVRRLGRVLGRMRDGEKEDAGRQEPEDDTGAFK
ncbi:pyridoxal phosphate-dependent transferase [Immersiella caudata]|uniref:Pyridoxal phosphate-dependent transferase n=1 Tax=Immersiella caudata TaxID=314043 RepID=A0AA40C875_9PEZI|nr:pyridoxal phosphate-dependent transferase [Immersiella caudata]